MTCDENWDYRWYMYLKVKGMFLVLAARGTRRAWFSQVVNVGVERGSLGRCVV